TVEAKEADRIFAHVRVDGEADLLAGLEVAQRARRGLHLVADAVDVDDEEALADGVDLAPELADHCAYCLLAISTRTRVARWLAWQMAMASASASSALLHCARGNNSAIMAPTWCFSAWPAPT